MGQSRMQISNYIGTDFGANQQVQVDQFWVQINTTHAVLRQKPKSQPRRVVRHVLAFTLKIRQARCVEGRRFNVEGLKCIVSITGIALHEHRQLVACDWKKCKLIQGCGETLEQ